ncbi:MAG: hypothetical protein K6A42_10655, partial [Treponema sp.]|nr:hypothetical protein [Treponema sp.]
FVQKGKWMSLAFPLFALISLFATITPLNLVDVPYKNQVAIIQKVYKEAGLLNADGTVDAKAANEKLERKQKAKVVSAYDQIKLSETNVKKPLWLLKSGEGYDFEKSFGFTYSNNYDKEVEGKYYKYKFEMDKKQAFDVSQYSSLYRISYCDDSDDKVVIKWGDEQKTDLTQETLSLLKEVPEEEYNSYKDDEKVSEKPLVLKTENGWTIVATYVYAKQRILDDGEKNFWSVDINGFVVK